MQQILQNHTSCLDCCFAIWNRELQTGCTLNRTDTFTKRDELVEAYNDTSEFYIINRICNTKRSQFWLGKTPMTAAIARVNKEVQIRFDILIYIGPEHKKEEYKSGITKTVESILKQDIRPNNVYVINHTNDMELLPPTIINIMRTRLLGSNIQWKVCNIIETQEINDAIVPVSRDRAIDITLAHITNTYFAVFDFGFTIPSKAFSELNESINTKLEQFSYAENEKCIISSQFLYKLVGGSKDKPFAQKIKEIAKNNNEEHLIKEVKDLCHSLS